MEKDNKWKNIKLTEEQISRAAEAILNAWLRENDRYESKSIEKNNK